MKTMSASASKKKRKELNEQGLSVKEVALQQEKEKKAKTTRNTIIFIAVILLCVACIIFLLKTLADKKYAPEYDVSKPVATVGDETISVPVYNFFYSMSATNFYNSYSFMIQSGKSFSEQSLGDGTLEDLMINNVKGSLEDVYNIYAKAKEEGYELTDEEKQTIDQAIDTVKEEAKNYGYSNVDHYMSERFGRGCDLDSYEEFLTVYTTYIGFLNKKQTEFTPSAEELSAKYTEDPSAFDFVTFTYATTAAEAEKKDEDDKDSDPVYTDEAKAKAKETAEGYKEEMPEKASTVTYQKTSVESYVTKEIADWLFDSARKEGDAEVFAKDETNTTYYTVRFDGRDDNDYRLANAYVISIAKTTGEVKEGEVSADEKLSKLMDGITAEMSDDEFTKLATDNGLTANKNTYPRTSSIEGLADFLYDGSRKAGDFTKLENDTTYYVVRFVGLEEDTYRDTLIKQSMWNEYLTEISSTNEIQIDEDQLKNANTDLMFTSQSSES